MNQIAVVRLRGGIKMNRETKDTLKMMGLSRVNTLSILPNKKEVLEMVRKVDSFITWGELSHEHHFKSNIIRMKPAKGGLKSIKEKYPRGDLGYRGEKINDLIKRMI